MDCQHIRTAIDAASRFEPMGENAQRHLRSCVGCREYADEMSNFLSLLKSTPRVTAPADFDFRLRARIAQAQAKRRNPFSFLEGFWSLSFSWGQTATAMATVALVATLGTFYFIRQAPTALPTEQTLIAKATPTTDIRPASPLTTTNQQPPQIIPGGTAVKVNRPKGSMKDPGRIIIEPATGGEQVVAVSNQIMVSPKRGGAPRLVNLPTYTYGAQTAVHRADNTLAASQAIF